MTERGGLLSIGLCVVRESLVMVEESDLHSSGYSLGTIATMRDIKRLERVQLRLHSAAITDTAGTLIEPIAAALRTLRRPSPGLALWLLFPQLMLAMTVVVSQ